MIGNSITLGFSRGKEESGPLVSPLDPHMIIQAV